MFLKCFGNTSSSKKPYPTVILELCHHFSLTDLRKSTNNFDENRLIDREAYSTVYKGYLQRNDGSDYTVAVKRCDKEHVRGWEEFKNEIELLCQLRHPNIISLIGFCDHKKDKIIVYEYMSNGSLYQHLRSGELSWKKRLEICIGAARGLHYLHAGAKRTIIHRNINPRTILLDDDMQPKLGGFALSIQGARFMSKPKPIKVDNVSGTAGYMAMEHVMDLTITDKTDVFSFGMVLLNFLKKPFENKIDANIKGKIVPECWQVFIDITQRCVKNDPDERPTMGEVEVELEHALALQEQADITNANAHYTLLSSTIIHQDVEPETNTEDIDTEEIL